MSLSLFFFGHEVAQRRHEGSQSFFKKMRYKSLLREASYLNLLKY